jgi:hypothetical protein
MSLFGKLTMCFSKVIGLIPPCKAHNTLFKSRGTHHSLGPFSKHVVSFPRKQEQDASSRLGRQHHCPFKHCSTEHRPIDEQSSCVAQSQRQCAQCCRTIDQSCCDTRQNNFTKTKWLCQKKKPDGFRTGDLCPNKASGDVF